MTTTGILVTAFFIILGIYDMIVVMRSGVACSVSRFLQRSALKSPIVAFSFGFIGGHLFGYMAPECASASASVGKIYCEVVKGKVVPDTCVDPNQKAIKKG